LSIAQFAMPRALAVINNVDFSVTGNDKSESV
jgi:hypothetical protein